ncbi:metal-dependent hydrolase [Haloterrigena sp. SYSU A121-1]|uniref:Metal-dependent hydrolase n=1 Tax=Haloterrigena gelatinilytica TaxID=2741724 RepID=A0A8J8GK72_9EURY|nr:metal-dependent hydrolase [Haloterrigena gelatinilytica]
MIDVADGLTHVLVAYALATLLSIRYPWITARLATVAMVGGMLPDLNRLKWVVPPETIEAALGASFSWRPMHSIGGVAVAICIASLTVRAEYRRAVALLLALGALSHFALDLLLVPPAGTYQYLWPLTDADVVFPGFYSSRDRWVAPVSIVLALAARSVARRHSRSPERESPESPMPADG